MAASYGTEPFSAGASFFSLEAEERIQRVARLLDAAVRIPVIGLRFGLDPLFSVVPVLGSLVGVIFSLYFFWEAYNLRVPWHVYVRMLVNLGIDALAGAVPVLGVLTDALFKANMRNVALILRYARRRSPRTGDAIDALGWRG